METFVVRIWAPADAAGDAIEAHRGIHGTAQHVGSGQTVAFRSGQELLDRLAEMRNANARRDPSARGTGGTMPETAFGRQSAQPRSPGL